jgi:uncharacterized metal-binding protein YceD (DUF177 family)
MDTPEPAQPPFSHPVPLSRLAGKDRFIFNLTPDAQILEQLATFLGALKVAKTTFSGTLIAQDDGSVVLEADLGASVTQSCVVTLKPVKTRIDEKVTRRFVKSLNTPQDDHQILPEDDENIDLLRDPIDLGVVATEAIALALPAYPRADDANLDTHSVAPPGVTPLSDDDVKPFASLAALRDKLSGQSTS